LKCNNDINLMTNDKLVTWIVINFSSYLHLHWNYHILVSIYKIILFCSHSWFILGFLPEVTTKVPLMEHELCNVHSTIWPPFLVCSSWLILNFPCSVLTTIVGLFFLFVTFDHCIVDPSSNYCPRLPRCHTKTFLTEM
jgi:hypothetical protein